MKPVRLPVMPENIPSKLRDLPQWVLWRWVWKQEKRKWDKPPFQANGFLASSSDPRSWSTFDAVMAEYQRGGWDGIGFVISQKDCFVGVDLDGGRNPESGEALPWAKEIIRIFSSFTEVSPSGEGFKILGEGKLPGRGHHGEEVGIFDQGRYFCITGHALSGYQEIQNIQVAIDKLIRERWPDDFKKKECEPPVTTSNDLPLQIILDKAFRFDKNGKFTRLWAGDWRGSYRSQSEADLALLTKILFWTGKDAEKADALFRQSGLYRPKWNYRSYHEPTMARALGQPLSTAGDEKSPKGIE